MTYKRIYIPLVDYLLRNQVFIRDIALPNGKELKIRLKFTVLEDPFKFKLNFKEGKLFVLNPNDRMSGPFSENEEFYLDPYETVSQNFSYGFSKLKLAKRLAYTTFSLLKHLSEGGLGYENRRLIKDVIAKFRKNKSKPTQGGLRFHYQAKEGKIYLICLDNGGIFDTKANGEGRKLPPRVMGAYYADAYSAYCFARRYLETKNKKYLAASLRAMEFVSRTYENYPKDIVWYHHDFKNPAYIETLAILKGHISQCQYDSLQKTVAALRQDFYEPTNVYALRYHWRNARKYSGFPKERKIISCLKRLRKDQTKEGLIHDNNLEDYNDAHDLTYHQYSLACIAGGLQYEQNKLAKEIFKKGCLFSYNVLTFDGNLPYNGRGANNIYHLSSAIYAFEKAALIFGESKFRRSAKTMRDYLSKWQKKEGYFPTAMNPYINERMAWNHCHTPYNALTGYFMYKANDASKTALKDNNPKKASGLVVMDDSGYASYKNDNYSFTFFSGCAKSYPLSEGCHQTGYAGTAILSLNKGNTAMLLLDKYLKSGVLASDMPCYSINGKTIEQVGRGKIMQIGTNSFAYIQKGNILFKRTFTMKDNEIEICTTITAAKKIRISSEGQAVLPLSTDYGWKLDIKKNSVLQKKGGQKILYSMGGMNLTKIIEVTSNPLGKGKIIMYGKLKERIMNKGENIFYCYKIKLFKA